MASERVKQNAKHALIHHFSSQSPIARWILRCLSVRDTLLLSFTCRGMRLCLQKRMPENFDIKHILQAFVGDVPYFFELLKDTQSVLAGHLPLSIFQGTVPIKLIPEILTFNDTPWLRFLTCNGYVAFGELQSMYRFPWTSIMRTQLFGRKGGGIWTELIHVTTPGEEIWDMSRGLEWPQDGCFITAESHICCFPHCIDECRQEGFTWSESPQDLASQKMSHCSAKRVHHNDILLLNFVQSFGGWQVPVHGVEVIEWRHRGELAWLVVYLNLKIQVYLQNERCPRA